MPMGHGSHGGGFGGSSGSRSHGSLASRSHGPSFSHNRHTAFPNNTSFGQNQSSSFGNSGFHQRHHYGGSSGATIVLDPNWDLKTSQNGEFESGLCDCCKKPGDCCVAWCFPCILDCTIANTVEKNGCCGCIACMCPIAMCCVRKKLREKKKINGSIFGDLAVILFCHLCAAVQMKKEIELRITPNQVASVVQINQPLPENNQSGAHDSQTQQNMNNQILPNQSNPTAIPPPPSYY